MPYIIIFENLTLERQNFTLAHNLEIKRNMAKKI